jgi:hypothetical protein
MKDVLINLENNYFGKTRNFFSLDTLTKIVESLVSYNYDPNDEDDFKK